MNLAVITATRGTSAYMEEMVRSVRALDLPLRHVLVAPAAACNRLRFRFPMLPVVPEGEGGLYGALNTGLDAIGDNWDAFTWINDDDMLSASGVTAALARLKAEPSLGVVYGRVEMIDTRSVRLGELPVARRPGDLGALLAGGIMPFAQPGTVIRRSVARQVGGFDPGYRLAGDLDYLVRALRAGAGFGFIPAEVAHFRLRPGQLSKDESAVAAEFARAVAGLPRVPGFGARWRFRWDNRAVYFERVQRHGFVRMPTLYRHG